MITIQKIKTTDSPFAKLIIDFMQEKPFGTHARRKSVMVRKLIETYFNERILLASGLGGSKIEEFAFRQASVIRELSKEPLCFQKIQMKYVIDYV